MDLTLDAEQEQIADITAAFARDRLPLDRMHDITGTKSETQTRLWQEMAEMGWFAMTLDEAMGGVGYSICEEVLVFRELGRQLAAPRTLFTVLGAKAAGAAGRAELARAFATGHATVALAVREDFETDADSLAKRRLYDFEGASHALAIDADRVRLIELEGIVPQAMSSLDKSVSMAIEDLSDAGIAVDIENSAIASSATLLQAAMFLGVAEACLDMITEYAKIRETFGKPIGSYQAVRHPCADMAIRCEAAWAQIRFAALLLSGDEASQHDAGPHIASARLMAEDAAVRNADDNIQLHGGIGVTEEFTAHYFLKRVHTMTRWFGTRREHLALLVDTPVSAF